MGDTHWGGFAADKSFITSGQFESTFKASYSHPETALGGISLAEQADTVMTGPGSDKLRRMSGLVDSLTVKVSLSVTGIDTAPTGITHDPDGPHTPWCGDAADKVYHGSGVFELTIKDSGGWVGGSMLGVSYDPEVTNVPVVRTNAGNDKMGVLSGLVHTTITTSIQGPDGLIRDLSFDGTNTPVAGDTSNKLFLSSGQFSATVKTSFDVTAIESGTAGIENSEILAVAVVGGDIFAGATF